LGVLSKIKEADMAVLRDTPYPCTNFQVTCALFGDPLSVRAGLCEVILPEVRVHVIPYRNGNERYLEPRQVQSLTCYGNLILKRGLTGCLEFYDWWDKYRNGAEVMGSDVIIELLNEDRSDIVMSWRFRGARPVKYHCSPLNALGSDTPLIETLELAVERLEMY
jgi:phage tail-like protein